MPDSIPQPDGSQGDAPVDHRSSLPSDRDEKPANGSPDPATDPNRGVIHQAGRDAESPIQDTERYGTPNDAPAPEGHDNGKSR